MAEFVADAFAVSGVQDIFKVERQQFKVNFFLLKCPHQFNSLKFGI